MGKSANQQPSPMSDRHCAYWSNEPTNPTGVTTGSGVEDFLPFGIFGRKSDFCSKEIKIHDEI